MGTIVRSSSGRESGERGGTSERGGSGERDDVLAFVAQNLRRLRLGAGMSQVALAQASGISRRMIVNLEGGATNISLSSLDHLAEALDATFVDLVSDPAAHSRNIEALTWRGVGPESEAVLLGSVPARSSAQLWTWTLSPGDRYPAEPDPEGWHEMMFVTEGRLLIDLAEGPVTVEAGGYAIYGSAQQYAYVNIHDEVTRFIRIVVA
jgi:transcriptional regulator with XRE-family HTH domain